MRRIVTWALSTLTVLVLLFSYHTSTSSAVAPAEQIAAPGSGPVASSSGAGGPPASGSSGAAGTSGRAASPPSSGAAAAGTSTVAGGAVDTRFGPVQVQLTVTGGKVTAVDVLQVPNGERRDQLINSRAVPILNSEAVSAQSAKIDAVSGATVTSDAYIQSLQSAIDKAHL